MLKAIFFDAGGTLIRLTKSVGGHYAMVAKRLGLDLDASEMDSAFAEIWEEMPMRPATGHARADDDKGWWRDLIERLLDRISAHVEPPERDKFFEAAYLHFTKPGVWEAYPEVTRVLETLAPHYQLFVLSNFDGRLRTIFEHVGISKYFQEMFISSELGADKPDPAFYRRVLEMVGLSPEEALHAGDDPRRDWAAAEAAGLAVFRLKRPQNSLDDLVSRLRGEMNCRKS